MRNSSSPVLRSVSYVLPHLALGGDKGMRWIYKETVYLKNTFCHHLHTLMLFQTVWISILLWNAKKYILKKVGSHWLPEHKKYIFWSMFVTTFSSHWFSLYGPEIQWKSMGIEMVRLSTFFKISSLEERKSYWFGTTWGWLNNDRIFIFGWTIPLKVALTHLQMKTDFWVSYQH